MRELWKYCFDLGEWKIIACKDVPQELASSSVTLSGNIIIIYGGTGVPFGAFCSNRMYLGKALLQNIMHNKLLIIYDFHHQ